MSFNLLTANTVTVGDQQGIGNITIGLNKSGGDLVNFIEFESPAPEVRGANLMVPVVHKASIGYDKNNNEYDITAAGGANILIFNSDQQIETLASTNYMTAGIHIGIQSGSLGGPASSLVISDLTDGHLISMDSTGLKILPAGTTGLNGAVLTSDGFGNCSWVGGAFERLEALEKKVGILAPIQEKSKTGTGGPSKPIKRKIRVPK